VFESLLHLQDVGNVILEISWRIMRVPALLNVGAPVLGVRIEHVDNY